MKKIIVKKDGPYSVSGGVLTAGDVNAYRILVDMGTDASNMTAMAICQENGEYSADYHTEGSMIGVTLSNSMYREEGYITVRFAVSDGDSVLTAKELVFRVVNPNNAETIAETEGGTLSDILTSVQTCKSASDNALIISNQALSLTMTKADADEVYTKDEINSKLASVYKYKGSVENYSDLPTEPSVGDVYNIRNRYEVNAYAVPIKEAFCTGYGDYIEDEYEYMYLNDTSMFNDELFSDNTTFTVYAEDGEYMGSFSPDGLTDCFAEQYINGTGLCGVISNIAYKETGTFVPNEKYAVNKIYYFVGCLPTDDYITVLRINPGDNVAWTGSSWDVLAGTVDLSEYATKDYIEEFIGLAMEGEY